MKQEIFLYLIGTAGSGKSTLAHNYKQWINVHGLDAIVVNLDPGAENLPYTPDVDIRDWISLSEVMDTHGLGPNGAQIACADMLALNTDDVLKSIESFKTDYIIIDTPGQIELFVFRQSGNIIIDSFKPDRSVTAYLIDHILAKNPSGFISQLLLSLTTQFRLGIPQINILSKVDLLSDIEKEEVLSWSKDTYTLEQAVMNQNKSVYREMSENIFRVIESFMQNSLLIPTSKEDFIGMDDIYTHLQFIFEGGEDALSD